NVCVALQLTAMTAPLTSARPLLRMWDQDVGSICGISTVILRCPVAEKTQAFENQCLLHFTSPSRGQRCRRCGLSHNGNQVRDQIGHSRYTPGVPPPCGAPNAELARHY